MTCGTFRFFRTVQNAAEITFNILAFNCFWGLKWSSGLHMFPFVIHLTGVLPHEAYVVLFLPQFHRRSLKTRKFLNCHVVQKDHRSFQKVNVLLCKNPYCFYVLIISTLYAIVKIRQHPISYLLTETSVNTISKILTAVFRNLYIVQNWQPMCFSLLL